MVAISHHLLSLLKWNVMKQKTAEKKYSLSSDEEIIIVQLLFQNQTKTEQNKIKL